MASIFSKIISGEIPCYKVAETANCFAFLDVKPLAKGHLLVVPKAEIDNFFDLGDEHYVEINLFAKELAKSLASVVPCIKVGMAVIGLEVAHAHIHLVPINKISDLNFNNPRVELDHAQMTAIAAAIAEEYERGTK
jgi:histidine triad (HIT) family protein